MPAGAGSAAEGIGDAHGRWLLVVDDATPAARLAGLPRGRRPAIGSSVDDLVLGGSLAGPDASLRTALDAALSSPSGRGVAVDADGEVIGTVTAGEVLAAIEQARGREASSRSTPGRRLSDPLSKAGAAT